MAYSLYLDWKYPLADTYQGSATKVTYEGGMPPGPLGSSPSELAGNFLEAAAEQGLDPITVKVWLDTSPVFETRFHCELILAGASVSSNIGAQIGAVWLIIVIAAMALAGIIFLWLVVKEVAKIPWPELKVPLSIMAVGFVVLGIAAIIGATRLKRSTA